jgi:hypothetical protein
MTRVTPFYSAVVPVFNESGNVLPLLAEIVGVLRATGQPFEVIFVNDGSTDATLAQLRQAAVHEPELRILDLDGNFGEAAALCAGFHAARGRFVITLDGDGQNDPHDIPRLLEVAQRNGHRVVSGWRQDRQEDRLLRVWPSRLANRLIAAVTGIAAHDNGCGLKVYRRELVSEVQLPRGMNRFMPAILGVCPHEVAEVPVRDRRRQHGRSHYGLGRVVSVLRDLPALRPIRVAPRRSEPIVAVATVGGVAATALGLWIGSFVIGVPAAAATAVAATVYWNLRRFNRAQRVGVYRVRREYSGSVRE